MHWLTYWPSTYLQVFATAFVLSAACMPIAIFLLRRFNIMDAVAANKIHERPVPRGGGIVIFFAFAVAVMWPGYRSHPFNGVMIGAFLCLVLGGLDDLTGGKIPGFWKLLMLAAVTLILHRYGVRLNLFHSRALDLLFTLVWIVGVTSAFNGTDNMDGLAGGIAIIVSAAYLFIAVQAWLVTRTETSLAWFGMLAAGLIGANLGFLLFNFKPARIFMGDSGSFFLGFMLAALGVMGEWTENRIVSCLVPILILGVPLFDFAYIIVARILKGETRTVVAVINHCAPDHLSHRLTWMGFTQRQTVLVIYLIAVALAASGVLVRNSSNLLDSALGIVQGLAILAIVVILMAIGNRQRETQRTTTEQRKDGK
ncbi:MAG TPA: MraY family glycosyltransferase [Candidatus Hydrogenedentes bacterium]|nr:MraY family glycosyltransferase [Candidatus Hydrogenedentota bacterium]HPC15073.1 MraY family glycosyltransferase [Candidatus Hydrogenedentota bacterium]HRT19066.1 MraY family glycosyltransferase [Candidatus Hydrogenedentota bacterium]HRT63995.1 MraY family glycosyltransferase [Candidatus Hydrogenedentota bacterium]